MRRFGRMFLGGFWCRNESGFFAFSVLWISRVFVWCTSIWSWDLGRLGELPAWVEAFFGHLLDFEFSLGIWATDVDLV